MGVKERSDARDKTAKTLQRRKVSVDYAPKNGKNFTALSRKSRERAKKRQKVYKGAAESADRMCRQEAKSTKLL
ncbi:hypothetical protein CG404_00555 [Bifidobacteriaceae bacterium VN003]|uniref:Uncharacterized protein n=1 Tax=Gardnerella vaginalis TaxID=2702 RepID=A0AAP8ISM9_GARVA|nr:hypothetical protein CYJ61_05060 [Gardnerella vaginalis]RFT32031.1 hypothetical protein CG404_00555 [Bifidobacteriaceae bacterium VN003]